MESEVKTMLSHDKHRNGATAVRLLAGEHRNGGRAAGMNDELRLAHRRAMLESLDPLIAPRLKTLLAQQVPFMPVLSGLTVYDAILPGVASTGGHWTVAARRIGPISHTVWTYTALLDFDQQNEPSRLRIRGRGESVTKDLSEAGLDRAVARAAAQGPLRTPVAHALAGISL